MGFVGSLFGTRSGNSGGAGLNYRAEKTPIDQPTNDYLVNGAYRDANRGVNQQQGFLNALQAQNGIQNQSNVYAQQQALANQLQGVSNGTGPNPVLNQYNQATGNNINAQSAMMASQRGASANAGLMARQAAMQGANIQQQAAGQSATLQSQQQLAGMSALQQQQNMMAGMTGNQVAQQANATMGFSQAAQSEQQNLLNSIAQQNNANVAMQSNVNNANAGVAGVGAHEQSALFGGLTVGMAGSMAHGGMVKGYADGGAVTANSAGGPQSMAARFLFSSAPSNQDMNAAASSSAPSINAASDDQLQKQSQQAGSKWMQKFTGSGSASGGGSSAGSGSAAINASTGAGDLSEGASAFAAKGGETSQLPHFDSGGLMALAPLLLALLNKGGGVKPKVDGEKLADAKKMVPGKASIKGNSLKNDTVPAMLSPKEIVIPRSITMSPNAPNLARDFVAKVLAKNGMGGK